MPRVTLKSLQEALDTNRQLREGDRQHHAQTLKELEYTKKRIADIAAENESLRMDKKWLQSMLSNTIQTLPEMFRNRNALPR